MWPIATNAASAGISRVSLASVVLCVAQAQAERDAGPYGVRTRGQNRACARDGGGGGGVPGRRRR